MVQTKVNDAILSQLIDEAAWKSISSEFNWNEQKLDKYRNEVDWTEVSSSSRIGLSFELLDRFADYWDWDELCSRYGFDINCAEFLNRYKNRHSMSELRHTNLRDEIDDERAKQL